MSLYSKNYTDDSTIPDDGILWRRIRPDRWVYDDNLKKLRPSSAAFSDNKDADGNLSPMSVGIEEVAIAHSLDANYMIKGHPGYGVVALTAELCRKKELSIVRDPNPQDYAHGLVPGKKTGSVKNTLCKNCETLIQGIPRL